MSMGKIIALLVILILGFLIIASLWGYISKYWYLILLLGIFSILLLLFFGYINQEFKVFVLENWQKGVVSLIVFLASSILAITYVGYTIQEESKKNTKLEIKNFASSLDALVHEAGNNQALLKLLLNGTCNETNPSLSLDVARSLLSSPVLYRYTDHFFRLVLWQYVSWSEELNNNLTKFAGKLKEESIRTNLKSRYETCLKLLYSTQAECERFITAIGGRCAPSLNRDGNDFVKKFANSLSTTPVGEFESEVSEMKKLSDNVKKQMQKSYYKSIEECMRK